MFAQLRPALILFAVLSIVTGMAYPLLVTGIAQTVFPKRANGSLEVSMEGTGGRVSSASRSPFRVLLESPFGNFSGAV